MSGLNISSMALFVTVFTLCLTAYPTLASNAFLADRGGALDQRSFRNEVMNAMGSMLGCGGKADPKQVQAINAALTPMWKTLPKTNGRIDRRSLRYLVHRYFMQTSSLMIRGFEPSRPTNDSHWGAADILSQMVPAYVESVLESHHSSQNGFSLQDAVDMVLMLDQLIFDSESTLLEGIYMEQGRPMDRSISHDSLKQVIESYIIKWMVDSSPEDHEILIRNRTIAAEVLPHYAELMKFGEGRIKAFEYERQGKDAFSQWYSFGDAHKVVGGITRSFQSYWQSECDTMKTALISMDSHGTGRVPLSKFYNTAINTDWRFGESESYLRELGALDESSSWRGPQVIIPNYLQATSNCIVSAPHYLVCCVNECEALMGEIERAIDAPTAPPSTILDLVSGMTSQTTLENDEPAHLDANLKQQLEQIAKSHGGMVPLHGRLFAQWLHYVFPHECPFPHKTGSVLSATPTEYGNSFVASREDMERHAATASSLDMSVSVGKEELQWMSQWSEEEELMVDYSSELSGPLRRWLLPILGVALVLAAAGGFVSVDTGRSKKVNSSPSNTFAHSHWV